MWSMGLGGSFSTRRTPTDVCWSRSYCGSLRFCRTRKSKSWAATATAYESKSIHSDCEGPSCRFQVSTTECWRRGRGDQCVGQVDTESLRSQRRSWQVLGTATSTLFQVWSRHSAGWWRILLGHTRDYSSSCRSASRKACSKSQVKHGIHAGTRRRGHSTRCFLWVRGKLHCVWTATFLARLKSHLCGYGQRSFAPSGSQCSHLQHS